MRRIALGSLLLAVFAVGIAFSFYTLFTRFSFWDDEGKLMLFTKHLLEGRPLYDQLHFIYGPTYALERWMILSWFGVPLTNDGVRFVTLVTWVLTALVLAATAWRLARDTGWAAGLAAVVGLAAALYLFVFANEPGHPQELVALLLASSFWIAATQLEKRTGIALFLLGVLTALLVLTKINVGVLFGLGLGMSLVALGPRPSGIWTLLRVAVALALLALPTILMRSRLLDGYGPFCFAITAALLPCCLFVLVGTQPSIIGFGHLVQCGLGAGLGVCVTVGFALAHGNTLGGLVQALVISPMQGFALVKYGWALALPPAIAYWSAAGAAIGMITLRTVPGKRRFLWLLRIGVCAIILGDVLFVDSRDSLATWTTLPLMWLLLVPPAGYEPRPTEWLFRLFLAFTACLQPIQIFPFPGSQVRIGTMATLLVGVMLVVDLYHELRGTDALDQFRDRLSEFNWNLILTTAALLVGCQAAFTQGLIYQRYVPLNLPGCRWTRFPEREAAQLAFVTANVRASSDCVVARIGLMSLDFWTDRSPPGTFVFGNEWDSLDPATNDLLLATFSDHSRMMFVDNPKPWYLKTHNLPFSSFVEALAAHKFLDFVSDHFKQLARVSSCRLLVRKERTDLELLDCAYTAGSDSRHRGNLLRIKLPEGANLLEVTRVEMADLQTGTWIASTDFDDANPVLNLLDHNGHETLRTLIRMQGYASFQSGDDLFVTYPPRLNIERMSFPVLRFFDARGKRLLTLPVAVETCLPNPPPFEQPQPRKRSKAGSARPTSPSKTH